MTMTALPSMEHTFTTSIKGSKTGRVYDGTFTYKIPDLKAESQIEKTKIRLNEGLAVSEDMDFTHEMVAYLAHTMVEAPEWFKKSALSMELYDLNVYTSLYQEASKFQKEWRAKVWADDGEQSK